MLLYLILTTIPSGSCYHCPHFTDEKTKDKQIEQLAPGFKARKFRTESDTNGIGLVPLDICPYY